MAARAKPDLPLTTNQSPRGIEATTWGNTHPGRQLCTRNIEWRPRAVACGGMDILRLSGSVGSVLGTGRDEEEGDSGIYGGVGPADLTRQQYVQRSGQPNWSPTNASTVAGSVNPSDERKMP